MNAPGESAMGLLFVLCCVAADPAAKPGTGVLWSMDFTGDWRRNWPARDRADFGSENCEILAGDRFPKFLRVRYPKGSVDPSMHETAGRPLGGAQWYGQEIPPTDTIYLRYYLRCAEDFDFVRGGKLPGLFGGVRCSGGKIPDGTDGFSTRFMWRAKGDGEVYAYLPTSEHFGASLGRGKWQFVPGKWHCIEQHVVLNSPGARDGSVTVWLDGRQVFQQKNLLYRTVDTLQIEGIFFSTFFGGSDDRWATPRDTHIDFANFALSTGPIGP